MDTIEFEKINNYVYNKFNKLVNNNEEKPKMVHDKNDLSMDIISIIEKHIIKICNHTNCCCEKSDIYKLHNVFTIVPILNNSMDNYTLDNKSYYNMYVKNKLKVCYKFQTSQYNYYVDNIRYANTLNYNMNKKLINALLDAIKDDNNEE